MSVSLGDVCSARISTSSIGDNGLGEPFVLLAALVLDAIVGDPDWLWRRLPHPVVVFGRAIGFAEERLNDGRLPARVRRHRGAMVILALVVLAAGAGVVLEWVAAVSGRFGTGAEVIVVAILLAQRSLAVHVRRVADGLREGGLAGGKRAVSMIVGRDVSQLDEAGVARAAVESLAENFSDGVVAPVLWYAIGGLPGLFAYKMINTADSMIGHRDERYRDFGRAAARIDDAANWLPARLAALLIMATRPLAFMRTWRTVSRDAPRHRSPNAGWPETAMACVSGLALGGPRTYASGAIDEPLLNGSGRRAASRRDIELAVGTFWVACVIQAVPVLGWMLA